MAYDVQLADRTREALVGVPGVTEKKMYGGLAFLVAGHMAIAASGQGDALVRADPAEADQLIDSTSAEVAVMQGRPMTGWLRVPAADLETSENVELWVAVATSYVRTLPPKS